MKYDWKVLVTHPAKSPAFLLFALAEKGSAFNLHEEPGYVFKFPPERIGQAVEALKLLGVPEVPNYRMPGMRGHYHLRSDTNIFISGFVDSFFHEDGRFNTAVSNFVLFKLMGELLEKSGADWKAAIPSREKPFVLEFPAYYFPHDASVSEMLKCNGLDAEKFHYTRTPMVGPGRVEVYDRPTLTALVEMSKLAADKAKTGVAMAVA